MIRRLAIFAAVVAALWAADGLLSGSLIPGVMISPYVLQVITLAGINIILAVSLNLINGFTGQFSIGHAGFMAIGAYTSAFLSVTFGPGLERAFGFLPEGPRRGAVLLLVLAAGAIAAGSPVSSSACRRSASGATTSRSSPSDSARSSGCSS